MLDLEIRSYFPYLMNGPVNLHRDNEVCITDRLKKTIGD